jgi:hypothetical protein
MRFRWGKDAEERRNYGINGISMQILDRRNMRDRKEKAGKFLTGLTRFKGFKDRGKLDRRNMRDRKEKAGKFLTGLTRFKGFKDREN